MLHLGTAWYPEHWPEERWPEDVRLMKEAGLTVVRLGEFAWSTMEPEEGRYELDWLARAVEILWENGILSVIGTPSAAPPAWLTTKYPETLAVDEYGRPAQHGNRCHYCVNSPLYHEKTAAIVTKMAERLGRLPGIIGWQIDNEFNRVCYCPRCRDEFQAFLRRRYGDLETLNRRWSTAYWSQTYTDWRQIPLPIGYHNPGLMLEFQRFPTESYRRFQKMQIEILRRHIGKGQFITHNFMGWFGGFDHYALSADLDLAAWDFYVGTGHHDYLDSGAAHDLTRGFKRKNFWLMETQPGCVNWKAVNNHLYRGEVRLLAWHAVAHGAEAVCYWQWRSAPGGQEQYHGTIIGADGLPRPLFSEIAQLGKDFARVGEILTGTEPQAEVAILNCYESRWSIEWQRHHRDFDYVMHLKHYYRPLARRNIPANIVSAEAPLAGYRLVIAPALILMDSQRAARLKEYVLSGGCLVLTVRCGMKDEWNALLPALQPGPLAEVAGVEVEEYYALDEPVPVEETDESGITGQARIWAELLRPRTNGVKVLARYGPANGWLDGGAAVVEHEAGAGKVYYCGAYLDEAGQEALFARLVEETGLAPVLVTPPGLEAARRLAPDGREVYFLLNHTRTPQTVTLPWPAEELLSGERKTKGDFSLEGYGIAILIRE
ncbi:MAG: beta-galactosidase [Firmicutes bacterium]|nr:beta-galactosidase [Bacillota bacterium]